MNEDDLREFELALDTHGRLSLEDSWRLIQEVRRRGQVITQMQQAIDYAGDTVPEDEEDARKFTKRYLEVIKHQG